MNWFRYRLPNSSETVCGASPNLEKGFGKGFVIAPFLNPEVGMSTIPNDFVPDDSDLIPVSPTLSSSTAKTDYLNEVESIINELIGNGGKIVAARAIRVDTSIDIVAAFEAMNATYPDAFVFAFSTSETGTWIGASPELLMKVEGSKISTMALAGTRPAFSNEEWDEKNIEEQQLVTDFIRNRLENRCRNIVVSPTITKNAGVVEHLCTPIVAELKSEGSSVIKDILTDLSPTPAVCGSDRHNSLRLISQLEKFPREMYGGFCGPHEIDGVSSFYVILRCAKCSPEAICVFAGGGILASSDPETEWNETELKSKTIINILR